MLARTQTTISATNAQEIDKAETIAVDNLTFMCVNVSSRAHN